MTYLNAQFLTKHCVTSFAFSSHLPRESHSPIEYFVTGNVDNVFEFFSLRKKSPLSTFKIRSSTSPKVSPSQRITSVNFDNTGSLICGGNNHGKVFLNSLEKEGLISHWDISQDVDIENITFHPTSNSIFAFSYVPRKETNGKICLVDTRLKNGKDSIIDPFLLNGSVERFDFSPNGKMMMSGSEFGISKLWDFSSTNLLQSIYHYDNSIKKEFKNHIGDVGWLRRRVPRVLDTVFHPSFYMTASFDSFGDLRFQNVDVEDPEGIHEISKVNLQYRKRKVSQPFFSSTSSEKQVVEKKVKEHIRHGKVCFVDDLNVVGLFSKSTVKLFEVSESPKVIGKVSLNWNENQNMQFNNDLKNYGDNGYRPKRMFVGEKDLSVKNVVYDGSLESFVCSSFTTLDQNKCGSTINVYKLPLNSLLENGETRGRSKKKKKKEKRKTKKKNLIKVQKNSNNPIRRKNFFKCNHLNNGIHTVSSMGKGSFYKFDCYNVYNENGKLVARGVLKDISFDWNLEKYYGRFSIADLFVGNFNSNRLKLNDGMLVVDLELCKKTRRKRL